MLVFMNTLFCPDPQIMVSYARTLSNISECVLSPPSNPSLVQWYIMSLPEPPSNTSELAFPSKIASHPYHLSDHPQSSEVSPQVMTT
jgi:hypothetical protein